MFPHPTEKLGYDSKRKVSVFNVSSCRKRKRTNLSSSPTSSTADSSLICPYNINNDIDDDDLTFEPNFQHHQPSTSHYDNGVNEQLVVSRVNFVLLFVTLISSCWFAMSKLFYLQRKLSDLELENKK